MRFKSFFPGFKGVVYITLKWPLQTVYEPFFSSTFCNNYTDRCRIKSSSLARSCEKRGKKKSSSPSTCTTFLLPFSVSAGREVTERAEVRMKTTKDVFPKARGHGCVENCRKGHNRELWRITGFFSPKMEKSDSSIPGAQLRPKNTKMKSTKDTKDNGLTSSVSWFSPQGETRDKITSWQ